MRHSYWLIPMLTAAIASCFVVAGLLRITSQPEVIPVIQIPSPAVSPVNSTTITSSEAYRTPPWLVEPYLSYQRPNRFGPEVIALQERLHELGYLKGEVDGYFGLATWTALKHFQVKQMLPPHGIVDQATSERLLNPIEPFKLPEQPPAPPTSLFVDIAKRTLTIKLANGDEYILPCSVGRPTTPTPTGHYYITDKGLWRDQFGGYWLGINVTFGRYGIHGTNQPWSIGEALSEGCIRLLNEHARIVYKWVPPGTPVIIEGLPSGRLLMNGHRGTDVKLVQERLISKGFLSGRADGIFGPATEAAVKKFQRANGLYPSGRVDSKMYELLEIKTDPDQGTAYPAVIRKSSQ